MSYRCPAIFDRWQINNGGTVQSKPKRRLVFILALLPALWLCHAAFAQNKGGFNLIRDAEIESGLKKMIFPILDQAGVDQNGFRLFIVQNNDLNAFVAGGQNIFLHTGLLVRTDNYGQLMGVIAHETGHIAGGHLARSKETLQDLAKENLILQAIAVAAMALGNGQAGAAVLGAGSQFFQRNALAYTRTQERSADQAGLQFLSQLGISPVGLLDFFKILQSEQKILIDKSNPYLQTHPLTTERIEAIQAYLTAHPELQQRPYDDAELQTIHSRIRAKLIGYLRAPADVQKLYPKTDSSVPARYARAIMYNKSGETENALREINSLIRDYPQDAYFYELRGEIYADAQTRVDAKIKMIEDYDKAVMLAPNEALIRLGLAQALIDRSQGDDVPKAMSHLKEVLRLEPNYGLAWRIEAMAQGKAGNIGKSALALSELALLQGDKKRAKSQAERAIALLKNDTITRQRAEDIKNQIEIEEKK